MSAAILDSLFHDKKQFAQGRGQGSPKPSPSLEQRLKKGASKAKPRTQEQGRKVHQAHPSSRCREYVQCVCTAVCLCVAKQTLVLATLTFWSLVLAACNCRPCSSTATGSGHTPDS